MIHYTFFFSLHNKDYIFQNCNVFIVVVVVVAVAYILVVFIFRATLRFFCLIFINDVLNRMICTGSTFYIKDRRSI